MEISSRTDPMSHKSHLANKSKAVYMTHPSFASLVPSVFSALSISMLPNFLCTTWTFLCTFQMEVKQQNSSSTLKCSASPDLLLTYQFVLSVLKCTRLQGMLEVISSECLYLSAVLFENLKLGTVLSLDLRTSLARASRPAAMI